MEITRRAMLATAMSAAGTAWFAPAYTRSAAARFPDSRALAEMIRPSIAALGNAAQVERLGHSAAGRPIDLISIGAGERSVLVVGAPHPNEPIGCLAVVALIRRLARDRRFLERSGWCWHFIPAIDVDGLDLNSGWFDRPQTLTNHFRHFFRPAFARQPEYSFPLSLSGYRFDASTPENLCWQRALAIARPTLQSSLHGNDAGGAFYLLSHDRAGLAQRLSRQPAGQGIILNTLGEPDTDLRSFAPGVFSYFEVEPYVRRAIADGAAVDRLWSAGRSSAEFAAETCGTFSMTCEVPLWQDRRQHSAALSPYTMADVRRMQLVQIEENARLLDRAAPLLARAPDDDEGRALTLALREAATLSAQQRDTLTAQLRAGGEARRISLRDLVQLEPGTALMRAPAMLARLATLAGDRTIASDAQALLARRIAAQDAKSPLHPVPTERAVALQIQSITTSMAELGRPASTVETTVDF